MKIGVIFLFHLLLSLSIFSQQMDSIVEVNLDNNVLFEKANKAYIEDDYQGSANTYMAIVNNGVESSELYFNLGNSYFKQGDLPNAILYYEKALNIHPFDEDIQNNLAIANLQTVDKIESKPELPFNSIWKELLNSNLIDDWGRKSIYISFLALIFMLLFLFSRGLLKKISFFAGIIVFSISLAFYFLGGLQKSNHLNSRHAIIFSPSVTVKSSPEDDGTKLFVIHEGTKVKILRNEDVWTQITLMNGNKGWLKTESFKQI